MISSKEDYVRYLHHDNDALGACISHPLKDSNNSMVWLTDPIHRWERLLRKTEYWENCHEGLGAISIFRTMLRWRFVRMSTRLGLSIPLNVFGPGLCILHYGSIVVSRHARIGENCTINSDVNIGAHKGGAPTIGDDVYIGPGAKVFGPIILADGIKIGANAVVTKSCKDVNAVLLGIPATNKKVLCGGENEVGLRA